MGESFNSQMHELKDLATNGIGIDAWNMDDNTEMKKVSDILTDIKKSAEAGKLGVSHLQKVISFLDSQLRNFSNVTYWHEFKKIRQDFVDLEAKISTSKATIISSTKKAKKALKTTARKPKKASHRPHITPTSHRSHSSHRSTIEYNYSTADKPELSNSVEDIVFRELASGSSTKIDQAIAKLKNLKVDIYDISSHLRIRDKDGHQMWKDARTPLQLGEGTNIDAKYTGNYKEIVYKGKKRFFIEIDLGNGKTGYIAAKYIKGELLKSVLKSVPKSKSTPKPTPAPKKSEKLETEIVSDYQKTSPSKTITGVGAPEYTGGETIVDGEKLNEFNTEIEKLKNKPKIKLILNLSKIWLDAARKASTEQWSLMGLRDDKEQIEKAILNISIYLQELTKNINLTDTERDKIIDKIFNEMLRIENNEEDIIDNIEEVKKLFSGLNESNYESRLAKLLELSAGGFRDGNTEKSKEISRDIIISKYFKSLENKLGPIKSLGDITYSNFGKLKLDNGTEVKLTNEEFNEIKEEIEEIYSETKIANERNKVQIKEELKKKQPHLTNSELDTLFDAVNNASALVQAKQFFIYKYTEKAKDKIKGTNDPILKAYQELDSFWQTSQDWIGENGAMIALTLVPMGGGAALSSLLAKISLRAVNALSKAKRFKFISNAGNRLKGLEGGHLATFAKGATFYEGMNITNNALYLEEWNLKELATKNHDIAELMKTALFFNVMKIANQIFPIGEKIISKQALKNFSTQVTAMTGIDLGVEKYLHGEEITKEQLGNSIITAIMYTLMAHGTHHTSKVKLPGKKPRRDIFNREIEKTARSKVDKNNYGKSKINKSLHDRINAKDNKAKGETGTSKSEGNIIDDMGGLNKRASNSEPVDLKAIETGTGKTKTDVFGREVDTKGQSKTNKSLHDRINAKGNKAKGETGTSKSESNIIDDMGGLNKRASSSEPVDLKAVETKTGTKATIETTKRVRKESTLHQLNGRGKYIVRSSEGKFYDLKGNELKHISDKSSLEEVKVERYKEKSNPNDIYIKTPTGEVINPEGKLDRYATYNNSEIDLKKRFQKIGNSSKVVYDKFGQKHIISTKPVMKEAEYTAIYENFNGTTYGVNKKGEYFNLTSGSKIPLKNIPRNLKLIKEN